MVTDCSNHFRDRSQLAMAKLTPEEEKQKKAIFDSMSEKGQKHILSKGYDEWDPFMRPKEPLLYKLRQEAKGEKVALESGHELYERFFAERKRILAIKWSLVTFQTDQLRVCQRRWR